LHPVVCRIEVPRGRGGDPVAGAETSGQPAIAALRVSHRRLAPMAVWHDACIEGAGPSNLRWRMCAGEFAMVNLRW
jgi:hypothetical protein